jgi:hypothetical protein
LGFEELCCQLYSLESPTLGSEFFRKEGSGGDAGVECMWTLPNKQVHGLQCKYFPDSLRQSQWNQIDESVETALGRHPLLSRYTICLPRDLTDRRQQNRKSQRIIWSERVELWSEWAQAKGMEVEFVYWGSAEIVHRLSRDDGIYSGRTLYWFDKRTLTTEWFLQKLEVANSNLGRRYTPEVNVELPIREVFNGLCRNPALSEEIFKHFTNIHNAEERLSHELKRLEAESSFDFDLSALRHALASLSLLLRKPLPIVPENIPTADMKNEIISTSTKLDSLLRYLQTWNRSDQSKANHKIRIDEISYYAVLLDRELSRARLFLDSSLLLVANSGSLLIYGTAGMGKSHLLADIAHSFLSRDWPVILLLGQHVRAGNPWDVFLSELDLSLYSVETLLGALDAAGQAAKVRTLIMVDAINEGGGHAVWRDHVHGFLTTIKHYPNLAVVITCRTNYLKSIFGGESIPEWLTSVPHRGFEGHESEAAHVYLSYFKIARPSTPLLSPEFSSPLFLRTCCEALNRQGETCFPKGLRGINSIFRLYLKSLNSLLVERMDIDPEEDVANKALERIAKKMVTDRCGAVARDEAKKMLYEVLPTNGFQNSLFNNLVSEGALSEDLEYPEEQGGEPKQIVRFTFERFSDHFIAEGLLRDFVKEDIEAALKPGEPLDQFLKDQNTLYRQGVVEALSIQIPEKYERELIAILRENPLGLDLEADFLQSIIWRDPRKCSDETINCLNIVVDDGGSERRWNTVLQVAAVPDHPLNADSLHQQLLSMELPIRDEFWSIYLAENYEEAMQGQSESITRTLVRWAWQSNSTDAMVETARLCGLTLAWFFTTSNRQLRDEATKALVSLLSHHPQLAPILLDAFETVNDPYVAERIYAAVYGAVLQGVVDDQLSIIALNVYQKIFASGTPPPHILLRDYARGIVEYALHHHCLPQSIDLHLARPPYASDEWPLEIPGEDEVVVAETIEYDAIRSSVLDGDFGCYVMGVGSKWSVTPLTKNQAERHRDRVQSFLNRIAEDLDPAVVMAFDRFTALAVSHAKVQPTKRVQRHPVGGVNSPNECEDILKGIHGDRQDVQGEQALNEARLNFLNMLAEPDQAFFSLEIEPYLEWGPLRCFEDSFIRFNINSQKRWVLKRAHSLGWVKDQFSPVVNSLNYTGRKQPPIERIGKKYQWIAWHELQARLSDHLYFIESDSGERKASVYEGPWQLDARNIDPSLLVHRSQCHISSIFPQRVWWRPAQIKHPDSTTEERMEYLWGESGFPNLKNLLKVQDANGKQWLVLGGESTWRDKDSPKDPRPRRETWLHITSFIVAHSDLPKALKSLNKHRSTQLPSHKIGIGRQVFMGEYPWHPACARYSVDWIEAAIPTGDYPISVRHIVPIVEYVWESDQDQSVDKRIDLMLPSRFLGQQIPLKWTGGRGVSFCKDGGECVFFNPGLVQVGPSAALVSWDHILQILGSLNLSLIWRIVGEKELLPRSGTGEFYGRQVLLGIYSTDGEEIKGKEWRFEERPRDNSPISFNPS